MYNVELIQKLKELERVANATPKNILSSVCGQIEPKLDYIFQNLIDINTVDIDALMKLIDDNKINYRIKSFIMTRLICDYDNRNEYHGNLKRQKVVEKYVFKIIT